VVEIPGDKSQCLRYCNDDADCESDGKCCSGENNCGTMCARPEDSGPSRGQLRVPDNSNVEIVEFGPDIVEVEEGDLAQFVCVARGVPERARIHWLHNGMIVI